MPDIDLIKDFIYEYLTDYLSSLSFVPQDTPEYNTNTNQVHIFNGISSVQEPLGIDKIRIRPDFKWFINTNVIEVKFLIELNDVDTEDVKKLEPLGFSFDNGGQIEISAHFDGEDIGLSPEFVNENFMFERIDFNDIDAMFDALEYSDIMDELASKIIEIGKAGIIKLSKFE